MGALDKAVTKDEDGSWGFRCPGVRGSVCGAPDGSAPFSSTGWPTRKVAEARGREHFDEHLGKTVMSSLQTFREKNGIGVTEDGTAVSLEDL